MIKGIKSTTAYVAVNGIAAYSAPEALPYVLGATSILWLAYIMFMVIAGVAGFMYGRFDNEDERQDFMADLADPRRRSKIHKKKDL